MWHLRGLVFLITPFLGEEGSGPAYFETLERYSNIIYPTLALLVVALVVGGILQAWRTQDMDVVAKAELKREIVLEMRRQVGGIPAELLARSLHLSPLKMVQMLEEMQRDGILISHTNTARLTLWRMKGVGGGGKDDDSARPRSR